MKHQTMRYPASTPQQFSGARRFVEQHGAAVWADLCDAVPVGAWFAVREVASSLPSLRTYRQPERYLRAVLKAVLADYAERPDAYEHIAPVQQRGRTLTHAAV